MFVVKKIVTLFFYPLSLCLGILILGLWCLWATRRQRLGKGLVTLGTVLLLAVEFAMHILRVIDSPGTPLSASP